MIDDRPLQQGSESLSQRKLNENIDIYRQLPKLGKVLPNLRNTAFHFGLLLFFISLPIGYILMLVFKLIIPNNAINYHKQMSICRLSLLYIPCGK